MNTSTKVYLGDSVYADFDGYHIVLTTENGADPSNTICLEPEVLDALSRYRDSLNATQEVKIPARLQDCTRYSLAAANLAIVAINKGRSALAKVADQLSDSVELNPYGGTWWLTVYNREDVQVLMQLAPRWEKSVRDDGIDYNAIVDGVEYKIRTKDGALPPTCRVIEREVEIPEQPAIPARKEMRSVVECTTATQHGEAAREEELRTEAKKHEPDVNIHD